MKIHRLIIALLLASCASTPEPAKKTAKINGQQIAFSRNKGNCLACHAIADGESPGNIGPPLNNLPNRYSNKQALYQQIYDARHANPETSMPPYGTNHILSPEEITAIVDYLWNLK